MNNYEKIIKAETPEEMTELLKECAMICLLCSYFNACEKNINIKNCKLDEYLFEDIQA